MAPSTPPPPSKDLFAAFTITSISKLVISEINAFNNCSEDPVDADLYVNLEPCSYFGKTPPCAKSIISNSIANVFIGMKDPNEKNNGSGIEFAQWIITLYFMICSVMWALLALFDRKRDRYQDIIDDFELMKDEEIVQN